MNSCFTNAVHVSQHITVAVLIAFTFTGCGGGSDSVDEQISPSTPTPTPTPTPGVAGVAEGLWTDGAYGQKTYVLVEPDGQMWGFPVDQGMSLLGLSDLFATKGNISAAGGTVSGAFRDVLGLGCQLVYLDNCPLSGLASSSSLTISGSYAGVVPYFSFNGTKSASNAAPVSVPVGTWNMSAAMTGNLGANGTVVVGNDRRVTAANIGGCGFTGTLNPVPSGQYFKLSVSTVSGSCAGGISAGQLGGVVFQTNDQQPAGVLHVMWHDSAYKRVFWSSGVR